MDPVHGEGPWTWSMKGVHGPGPKRGSMDQGSMFCPLPTWNILDRTLRTKGFPQTAWGNTFFGRKIILTI